MCGVFGFAANDGEAIDLDLLRAIAVNTESRGHHASGLAWIDQDDRLRRWKQPGPISEQLEALDLVADAKVVIGHCRYATHGRPEANENNHPHPADGGWIVHNGVVRNAVQMQRRLLVPASSDCDSEVLGLTIEEAAGTLLERCATTVRQSQGPLVLLGLWARPQRLVIVRRGNPLAVSRTARGSLYLASLPDVLPAPLSIREGTARSLTIRGGQLVSTVRDVEPSCPSGRLFDDLPPRSPAASSGNRRSAPRW